MSSGNIFLTERGFGKANHGEAVIVCGAQGQPLNLRLVITPNGSVGGQLTIVPLDVRDEKRSTSDINKEETVYELKVVRNSTTFSGGTIRIKEIDCRQMTVKMMETGFTENLKSGAVNFMESFGMENSEVAKELLYDKLQDAFLAALNRTKDNRPAKIYFGRQATDIAPIKRKWFNKETKQDQDEKPVYSKEYLALVRS